MVCAGRAQQRATHKTKFPFAESSAFFDLFMASICFTIERVNKPFELIHPPLPPFLTKQTQRV